MFLIILIFFTVFVILSSAIFSLKTVELKYLNSINVLAEKDAEVIESGKFRYGENIFFSSKKNYINNLEKSNPYLRVINIETIFPSKFIIHAVERNECYVIKLSNNKYAVLDEYMKVLKILDVYKNNATNGIEILDSNLKEQEVEAGDFFKLTDDYFKVLFNSFREWKIEYSDVLSKVTSIQLNYKKQDQLLVNMRSGVSIVIENSSVQLSDKINLAFTIYDTTEKNGEPVDYTKDGTICVFETETSIYGLYKPAE